jgi:Na+/serine symporter
MSAMPLEYSPERAIYILRQIAADTGVSIVSYTLPSGVLLDSKDSKISKGKTEMVEIFSYLLKITVSAPVDVIMRFVSKVESSLPYGLVSDLNLQEVTKLTKSDSGKNVQMSLELKYFQSAVNPININKIAILTDRNLENARQLVGYNLFSIPEDSIGVSGDGFSGSTDIFGF